MEETVILQRETADPLRSRGNRYGGNHKSSKVGITPEQRRPAENPMWNRPGHVANRAWSIAGTSVIHLPSSVRVYVCLSACDMRKSFDGLSALVRDALELDALAGHLYVFANRRRDRVKILYWDRDGFAVWSKRLEEGTYAIPFD